MKNCGNGSAIGARTCRTVRPKSSFTALFRIFVDQVQCHTYFIYCYRSWHTKSVADMLPRASDCETNGLQFDSSRGVAILLHTRGGKSVGGELAVFLPLFPEIFPDKPHNHDDIVSTI